jgi:hypothetical protein
MIPNAEDLLALEPEELAGLLLEHLNSLGENSSSLQLHNFLLPVNPLRWIIPKSIEAKLMGL